jgi:hypothetical protein
MKSLSKIKRLKLTDVFDGGEAGDFTPWLAENMEALGDSLGLDLEFVQREAGVGDFSLDLLAKDLGSGRMVVIENQLNQTDHTHLGQLLTYAGGHDAGVVIWIAGSIREEHRQAVEWLNEKTDTDTEFFAVVVEVLKIDDSKPAYNFRPVAFPNDWQRITRRQAVANVSPRGERYRQYFQPLIDELREKHRFTNARVAQPQSWYAFSSGTAGVLFSAVFASHDRARVEVYLGLPDREENKALFDWLLAQKDSIEKSCGFTLEWERLEERRASRISVVRAGSIDNNTSELDEIRKWQIEKLLVIRKLFAPLLKAGVKEVGK